LLQVSAPSVDLQPIQISFQPRTAVNRFATRYGLALPILGSVVAIVAFLYVALTRVSYPFELEWLESGIAEHVDRLVNGQSIYNAPSTDFVQLPYAPLYFALGAVASLVGGVHFWTLRVISLLSIVATFAVIHAMVKRETQSLASGFIAAGLFAGTFALSGYWFDVAKPDSLFLALTIGGVYAARSATTWRSAIVAALIMTLAVFAKQTAVFVLAPIGFYLLATKWRVGVAYLATSGALLGSMTVLLNAITHGWYNYFVWELLFQHEIIEANKKLFFTKDLQPFWPVALLIIAAAPRLLQRKQLWATGFYSAAIVGLVAGAYSSRLHSGGAENVLMPAFASAAIAAGLSLGMILKTPRKTLWVLCAIVLCVMQFAFVRYDPNSQIPTTVDQAATQNFVNWLRTIPGDVWVVDHPAYALMADKPAFAGKGSMEDIWRAKKSAEPKAMLVADIEKAIHERHFSAIIFDGPDDARGFPTDWTMYYEQLPGSAIPSDLGHPIVNNTGIPRDVWVPIGTAVPMPAQ
jgi:hypothetical protein